MTFNEWWNADNLTINNPYEPDSAAYWAWEGWQAAVQAEREKQIIAIARRNGKTSIKKSRGTGRTRGE